MTAHSPLSPPAGAFTIVDTISSYKQVVTTTSKEKKRAFDPTWFHVCTLPLCEIEIETACEMVSHTFQ
jgi:hypothetical protein